MQGDAQESHTGQSSRPHRRQRLEPGLGGPGSSGWGLPAGGGWDPKEQTAGSCRLPTPPLSGGRGLGPASGRLKGVEVRALKAGMLCLAVAKMQLREARPVRERTSSSSCICGARGPAACRGHGDIRRVRARADPPPGQGPGPDGQAGWPLPTSAHVPAGRAEPQASQAVSLLQRPEADGRVQFQLMASKISPSTPTPQPRPA